MTRENASRRIALAAAMSATFFGFSFPACAQNTGTQTSQPATSTGPGLLEKSGEQLFARFCRGCHMSDGKGATGAGTYPSLAGNSNLEAGGYAISIVVNGQRGMPPFGAMLSDDQVAAIVNYVRMHFNNGYQDAVTVEDVRALRR